MKHESTTPNKGLSRRNFLQAMAVMGGTAALSGSVACTPGQKPESGSTVPTQAPEETLYQGVCRGNCGGGCHMNVHVREGKVVKTSVIIDKDVDPIMNRICQRGLTHALRVYAPERIKYPMRRKEGTPRGGGEWEQLTWDEAITYITDKWKGYIDEYGGSSIAFTYGAGSYTQEQYIYMRLRFVLGGVEAYQGYDQNGLYMLAQTVTRGLYLHGNSPNSLLQSKYIFMIGANATTSETTRWAQTQSAVLDHGAELIVIDPNYTCAASKATEFIPIRPGTDTLLIMAMTNIIVNEGLQDDDYLAKGSVAPFLVKSDGKYLRQSDMGIEPTEGPVDPRSGKPTIIDPLVVRGKDGTVDVPENITSPVLKGTYTIEGKEVVTAYQKLLDSIAEWTPERASEMCDIPVEKIYELARKYAEGPSTLYTNWGPDHWVYGYTYYHAISAMAAIAGQFGKMGTGFQGSCGGSNMGRGGNIGAIVAVPGFAPGPTFPLPNLEQVVTEKKLGEMPVTIKSLFNHYSNCFCNLPDRNSLIRAIDQIELFITADSVMNDTSRYADVILPVPHWYEFEAVNLTVTPFARISEKAIDPLYETKEDIEIANMLAEKMGYGEHFGFDNDSYFQLLFDNPIAEELGLTLDALRDQKNIRIVPDDFIFGENYTLPTPTKRLEFYFENVTPQHIYGQPLDLERWALPRWEVPDEAWSENPLFEKYPLTLMSHRDKFKVHTTFSLTPWLEELNPEPTLNMNPVDAQARGISEGDYVRVVNDRGMAVLKAHMHAGIRPGVVDTEHTWYQERYKDGHYATLTNGTVNNFINATAHFDTLVQVEKA
ncbi:MAG: molybdopterin-dependent oxidoreductase [Eggerthellaceae bacterium]|nr:molybdopterin-dependent oxidoreductase [Eggerthellaceae bacterium]